MVVQKKLKYYEPSLGEAWTKLWSANRGEIFGNSAYPVDDGICVFDESITPTLLETIHSKLPRHNSI